MLFYFGFKNNQFAFEINENYHQLTLLNDSDCKLKY